MVISMLRSETWMIECAYHDKVVLNHEPTCYDERNHDRGVQADIGVVSH